MKRFLAILLTFIVFLVLSCCEKKKDISNIDTSSLITVQSENEIPDTMETNTTTNEQISMQNSSNPSTASSSEANYVLSYNDVVSIINEHKNTSACENCPYCNENKLNNSSNSENPCAIEGCIDVAYKENDLCITHLFKKCQGEESCYQLSVKNSFYCAYHKCIIDSCAYQKLKPDTSVYCQLHSCGVNDCSGKVKSGSFYCDMHTCKYASCNNAAYQREACLDHTCSQHYCYAMRRQNSFYCVHHG